MKHPINYRCLPHLPAETYSHILSFCEPDVLADASRVSLAFLELAGPILYRHVTITGLNQLDKLFHREEEASYAPHLHRFLSLDQTHTFTFNGSSRDTYYSIDPCVKVGTPRPFGTDRTTNEYPIQVDTLDARFYHPGEDEQDQMAEVVQPIIELFDPTHVLLSSVVPTRDCPLFVDFRVLNWTSLRTLGLSGIKWEGSLRDSAFFSHLPANSFTLIVDLASSLAARSVMRDVIVEELAGTAVDGGAELISASDPQVKEVVIKVASEKDKSGILKNVRGAWSLAILPVSQKERTRREAKIRFVVG